jgi:geranylgeranyl diphosphate synthase type II
MDKLNSDLLDFSNFLNQWLNNSPFGVGFQDSAEYILKKPGKYIRPLLVYSVAKDLNQLHENHSWLALSIELHHNYTLIHDDLPCMDNDDIRRGQPTVHKVFGEAHALLLGDILLAKSFELLANIKVNNLSRLLRIFSFATGAKGLILGQKIDLETIKNKISDSEILRMYELKTARLFQLAMVSSLMLTNQSENFKLTKVLSKLGSVAGILFQLIDDYEDRNIDKKNDFNFFKNNEESAKKALVFFQEKFKSLNAQIAPKFPSTSNLFLSLYKDFH